MIIKIAKLNDFHIPDQCNEAIRVSLNFLKYMQPDILIIDEVLDWPEISKFPKAPRSVITIQENIIKGYSLLKRIRDALPNTDIIMVESNHDVRLDSYLKSNAGALYDLQCLKLENLLKLKDLNIKFQEVFVYRDRVIFKHGKYVSKHSCFSAKAEMEATGLSGFSGHTHRLGIFHKTNRAGDFFWCECGHLRRVDNIDYIKGVANWQQGLGLLIHETKRGCMIPYTIPIVKHKIYWDNQIFR